MGIVSNMNFPSSKADLEPFFQYLPPEIEIEKFIKNAQLRESSELVEELEFYYCLHWAKRHSEAWRLIPRINIHKKLNVSVIRERRKALEWVVNSSFDWDDISLDT